MYRKLKQFFAYRHLLIRLVVKELKVRYKHPLLGIMWAFLVPFCTLLVLMVIFTYFIKVPAGPYPFFLFLASALFPWNYFSSSLTVSTTCLLDNSTLIKSAHFARAVLPVSAVLVNATLFVFSFGSMCALMLLVGAHFSRYIVLLPVVVIIQTFFLCGICLVVSSLHARYRDVKYLVEILLILSFYASPVFYPPELAKNVSEVFFRLYMLNPVAQHITLYRVVLIEGYAAHAAGGLTGVLKALFVNAAVALAVFLTGFGIFKRQEPILADMV